ncbi:hypothetical protein JF50_13255 [Pseudoalteromonas luteoviolacea]|uniref:Uncharacterized protein n=1 Tax=Pseudoalteromonas luteoviolacea TaxID=43657 RepID=A0A0C1MIL9_9GAMM|nr:hypothetical protein [Pseudoalteromonas luteoviolacea]KID56859.1 hypothetical protein JF50_13255 [Pseudoalteromonas luteoviolacea]
MKEQEGQPIEICNESFNEALNSGKSITQTNKTENMIIYDLTISGVKVSVELAPKHSLSLSLADNK